MGIRIESLVAGLHDCGFRSWTRSISDAMLLQRSITILLRSELQTEESAGRNDWAIFVGNRHDHVTACFWDNVSWKVTGY